MSEKLTYEELYEKCKYFMSEYNLLVKKLNEKNKEITALKREILKLKKGETKWK